MSSQTLLYCR
jgi:hypothetical protein